jgi:hypothetical protein
MSGGNYLGDGLYASFDGYQIRLYTERGDGTHEVFLDDRTLAQFERFVADLRKRTKGQR